MTTLEARLLRMLYEASRPAEALSAQDRPPQDPPRLPPLTDEQFAGMDDMADIALR